MTGKVIGTRCILRLAIMPRFLLLAILGFTAIALSNPATSQTATNDILLDQKLLKRTAKLNLELEVILRSKALAILSAYGGWTIYSENNSTGYRGEKNALRAFISQQEPDFKRLRRQLEREANAEPPTDRGLGSVLSDYEEFMQAGYDIVAKLQDGQIEAASAIFRDVSVPLSKSISQDLYGLSISATNAIEVQLRNAH